MPKDYKDGHKITLMEVVKWVSWGEMRFLTQVFILISLLFWLTRAFAVVTHVVQYWDIKSFYNTALNISDSSLGHLDMGLAQSSSRLKSNNSPKLQTPFAVILSTSQDFRLIVYCFYPMPDVLYI